MLVNGKEQYNLDGYDLAKDQIITIDHMFPPWFQAHIFHLVFKTYSWQYGHTSTYKENDPMWDAGHPDENWEEVPCYKQQIYPPVSPNSNDSAWGMIMTAMTSLIPFELELEEIIINGQQHIHNTVPHTDCTCDNGLTWIYYANKEWRDEWGGSTRVQINGTWHDIYPRPGRIVVFKGNLNHHGLPPNEIYKGLRATVVYKTMRKIPLPPRV
jgi:hypothetical protein